MGGDSAALSQLLANSENKSNQSKIATMMAKLQEYMNCDATCKKERQKKILKDKLQAAENCSRNGPQKVKEAEKKLYEFVDGKKVYRDSLLAKYTTEATADKNARLKTHEAYMRELTAATKTYDSASLYSTRITELQDLLEKENKQLQIDIDNEVGATQTDDRRMIYESREITQVLWIRKLFALLYYLILLVYLFTSRFFEDKKYLNWKMWLYIVLYILFPFIIDFLSRTLHSLYQTLDYVVSNKLPRNVYV